METKISKAVKKAVLLISFLLLWHLIYYLTTDVFKIWKPYMFPDPLGVIATFMSLSGSRVLFIAVAASLQRVLAGFLLSVIVGSLLGFLIYNVRFLNEALKPVFLGFQTLPSICWLPFAILWFGLTDSAIIFVIVVGSAFSIALAVETGLKSVNPLYIRAGKTMGASPVKILFHIVIPDALPHIIVGFKQGWSFSWRALMNGEMLSATKGLGQILMFGRDLSDINQVMCVIIVIMLLGMAIDRLLFGIIEKKMRQARGIV